jgi:hypothetical protein
MATVSPQPKVETHMLTLQPAQGGLPDDVMAKLVTAALPPAAALSAALDELIAGCPGALPCDDIRGTRPERGTAAHVFAERLFGFRIPWHDEMTSC